MKTILMMKKLIISYILDFPFDNTIIFNTLENYERFQDNGYNTILLFIRAKSQSSIQQRNFPE